MSEDPQQNNVNQKTTKILKWLLILAITATLIYCILIGLAKADMSMDQNCGYKTYGSYARKPTTNSSTTLTDNNTIIFQEYTVKENNNIGYEFCYELIVTGPYGAKIQIKDPEMRTLGTDFLINTTTNYCTEIVCQQTGVEGTTYKHLSISTSTSSSSRNVKPISKQNFLGIKCVSCNSSTNIIFREELTGISVNQIKKTGEDYEIIKSTVLAQELIGKQNCRSLVKFWTVSYFSFLMFLLLMIFVFVGWREMNAFFITDFERRMS